MTNFPQVIRQATTRSMPWLVALLLSFHHLGSIAAPSLSGVDVPQQIEGVHRVNAEELIQRVDSIPTLIIIDSRITSDRKHGHIEGSISLPDINTDCDSLAQISPQKSHPLVFYCNGVKCGRSVVAVRKALACGYDTVYWFRGGFEEWLNKDYPYITQ